MNQNSTPTDAKPTTDHTQDLLAALKNLQMACAMAAMSGEPVSKDDPANLQARAAIAKATKEAVA